MGRARQFAASGDMRVGHIGGDDFLVLSDPESPAPLAASALDAPWSAGGLPVTPSPATVLCMPARMTDHREAAACLEPLKKAAKALRRASRVLGHTGLPGYEIRRGMSPVAAEGPGSRPGPGPESAGGPLGAEPGTP